MHDVIVVGTGMAGLSAALAARQEGATVVVLEKNPREKAGEHLRLTHSFLAIANDYSSDEFYTDMMEFTQGKAEPELLTFMISQSASAPKWLEDFGITKEKGNTGYSSVSLGPASGLYRFEGGGGKVVDILIRKAEELGIEFRFECSARRLLQDSYGRITGVKTQDGKTGSEDLFARGGVVLATGGFEANVEMITKYLWVDHPSDLILRGPPVAMGDGHRLAMEVFAKPYGEWDEFSSATIDARSKKIYAGFTNIVNPQLTVLVNQEGLRFVDEGDRLPTKGANFRLSKYILRQPGKTAFCVFDKKVETHVRKSEYMPPLQADKLETLGRKIGVHVERFLKTIDEYNSAVQEGSFDPHHLDGKHTDGLEPPKSNWALRVDSPPFYAYPVTGGLTFTLGGLETDSNGQVVDIDGKTIPGLYAAGNLTGIILHNERLPGSALTRALVFGRAAGKKAAQESLRL